MSELVTLSVENHVADVRLNRPDKYNALSLEMMRAMADTLEQLEADKTIRAVVLSGNGKGFCAGLDLENFSAMQNKGQQGFPDLRERYQDGITNLPQHIAYGWRQLRVPVIAAIHGVAYGGGAQIALGADMRLCRADAKFCLMEMKWGLIPDMSATQTLRDLIPIDVAQELIYTARVLNGTEAQRLGLMTRVCDAPYEAAMTLAREIAAQSPHAVRAAKKLLYANWQDTPARGLLRESETEMSLIGSPNQMEAILAAFENRTPDFKDPHQT